MTAVAAVPEIVGATLGAGLTLIENAGNDADARPSLTLMPMFANEPTFAAPGVPERRPVAVLNVAHVGRFVMLNVNALFWASVADGWNTYCVPTIALVPGVPEMVGAVFAGAPTVIAKAASAADA
jgi:hypothetical protein